MKLEPVGSVAVLGLLLERFEISPTVRAVSASLSLTSTCGAGEKRTRLLWLFAETLLGTTSGDPRHSEHEGCGRNGSALLGRFSLRDENGVAPLMKWPHRTQHNVLTSLDRHEPSRRKVESGAVCRKCLIEAELSRDQTGQTDPDQVIPSEGFLICSWICSGPIEN